MIFLKNENEIIKLIDNVEIIKRYYVIKKIESSVVKSNLDAYKNLIFLAENIKNLFTLSDQEEIEINRLNNNLSFNSIKYYSYKILGLADEDKDLEGIIKLLKNYVSFEKNNLPFIKKMLYQKVSEPYILLYLLIDYKDRLLKYYNDQLLIFESNCKGFNAFTNQDDLEYLYKNTDKIIKLVKNEKK